VDLGVTALAVLSTGEVAPNPRHLAGTGMAELGRQIQYKTAWTGGRVHTAGSQFDDVFVLWRGESQAAPVRPHLPLPGLLAGVGS
jgi:hypothetical protein